LADNNAGVLWGTGYGAYGAPINGVGTAQTMYGFTGEPTDGNDSMSSGQPTNAAVSTSCSPPQSNMVAE
jgi:hypothetical protein